MKEIQPKVTKQYNTVERGFQDSRRVTVFDLECGHRVITDKTNKKFKKKVCMECMVGL
jgi:hypothetical protein